MLVALERRLLLPPTRKFKIEAYYEYVTPIMDEFFLGVFLPSLERKPV